MHIRRLLPLSGVVFVILSLVAVIAIGGDTPEVDASPAEVFSYYDSHQGREAAAAFLFALSVPFLIFFAAVLANGLRRETGGKGSVWRWVLVGGAALTGAAALAASTVHFGLADGADNDVSAEALQALNVLDNDFWVGFVSGLGVMMLGAAGCFLAGLLPHRWLGWAALVLGIVLFIPFADFFALLLTLLWIIVASIALFIAARAEGEAAAPA